MHYRYVLALANIIFSEETQKEKGMPGIVLMPGFKSLGLFCRITYYVQSVSFVCLFARARIISTEPMILLYGS